MTKTHDSGLNLSIVQFYNAIQIWILYLKGRKLYTMKNTMKILLAASAFILAVAGCQARPGRWDQPTEPLPSGTQPTEALPSGTEPTGADGQLGPGDYKLSLSSGGQDRRYLLHVPASYDSAQPVPLILVFHGAFGSAETMAAAHGWIRKSDEAGFVVAFPNGSSRLASDQFATWNAGDCCGYAAQSDSDDVGFVQAVIADLRQKVNVTAIFAAGMSNGGMFSYRLACDMADTFSAIASVAGTENYTECNPANPISILHIHGLQDERVPFNGGCGPECDIRTETNYVSVPDTIARWVERDGCDPTPQKETINENAWSESYGQCLDGVQIKLYVVEDGSHSWPGGENASNPLEKDTPSSAINATDVIWEFFSANGAARP